MDPRFLAAALPEIQEELAGRPVTKVELYGKFGVLLRFGGSRRLLWFSAHPERPRIGLLREPPAVGQPRPAADSLTETVRGSRLRSVSQETGGRVARIVLDRGEDAARHRELEIVGEMIPRFANVILVGDGARILWCCREFRGEGRPRQIAPGETYTAPSGGPAARPASDDPLPIDWPPAGSANDALDAWFRPQEEAESDDQLIGEVRRLLVKRRKRAAKALQQITARLADADREAQVRHHAELLAANVGAVRRGMESVKLPEFDGSGEAEILLDPKLDARGNVEALFKKARRLARGHDELTAQKSIQEAELEDVDAGIAALEEGPEGEALRELVGKVAPSLLRAAPGPAPQAARAKESAPRIAGLPEGFLPRRYVLPGGWEVLVGRNAKQNDELTHRHTRPHDLWFHARGAQGSHTVLRVASGKGEPSKETLEAAAAIAAFHSKARNSSLVPVAYTEKRYVRKPRKSPVGTAMMMREKVVMVAPALPDGGDAA